MEQENSEIADMIGAYPLCGTCGSRNIIRDAGARWNFATVGWELKSLSDRFVCDDCSTEVPLVWTLDQAFRQKRIARLNDALRRGEGDNATIVITAGVEAIGREFLHELNHTVARFDAFSADNDPHKEHDFGAFVFQGQKLFWKIDYFDLAMKHMSADPANAKVTHRVLTIMLTCEY